MHVQPFTFRLTGIDPAAYAHRCEALAPVFAGLPGLLAKVWLGDAGEAGAGGPFGGVYLWQDRAALEGYRASDVYAQLRANPALTDVADVDFPVLEAPTRLTAAFTRAAPGAAVPAAAAG